MGFFDKLFKRNKEQEEQKVALDEGLKKTKEGFFAKITKAIAGKDKVDEELLDELEEALVSADVGIDTTIEIIKRIEDKVAKDKYLGTDALNDVLQEGIMSVLTDAPSNEFETFDLPAGKKPYVLLVVGVNGVGKTTTIGKLAHNFKKKVDGTNSQCLGNHLMEELSKIRRVISKKMPDAPHEVLLVLDGSTGQNALEQAKHFTAATDITALAITKLDGTAKGGVVLAIAHQFKIPVKYIGVGERMEDLQIFNKAEFVDSLFSLK